ncbi:hypothetical protein FB451DRAFT_1182480 [Mycena latifolia]|nr:hypothetical protein FB451DRAFT_1182480 [Mycena latifolia]
MASPQESDHIHTHISLIFRIEPLLYKVICVGGAFPLDGFPRLTDQNGLDAIASRPPSFFHCVVTVRHLWVDRWVPGVETILAAFPGVTHLSVTGCNLGPRQQYLEQLLLRYLAMAFYSPVSFASPMFWHVTHFEVKDARGWTGLLLIPHLTHFGFNIFCGMGLDNMEAPGFPDDDVRFVAIPGSEDVDAGWTLAEKLVASQRAAQMASHAELTLLEDAVQGGSFRSATNVSAGFVFPP